jgi:hypothetical protein
MYFRWSEQKDCTKNNISLSTTCFRQFSKNQLLLVVNILLLSAEDCTKKIFSLSTYCSRQINKNRLLLVVVNILLLVRAKDP